MDTVLSMESARKESARAMDIDLSIPGDESRAEEKADESDALAARSRTAAMKGQLVQSRSSQVAVIYKPCNRD